MTTLSLEDLRRDQSTRAAPTRTRKATMNKDGEWVWEPRLLWRDEKGLHDLTVPAALALKEAQTK